MRPLDPETFQTQRLLVLAPHADDEMLGCGGAMLRLFPRAAYRQIVYVMERKAERRRESDAVNALLDIRRTADLDVPEFARNYDDYTPRASARLAEIVADGAITYLFTPSIADPHPDHRFTNRTLAASIAGRPEVFRATLVAQYEGFTPLAIPNRWLNLDDVLARKLELLRRYDTQQQRYPLAEVSHSLNSFRGLTLLRRHVRAAECYTETTAEQFKYLVLAATPRRPRQVETIVR